MASHVTMPDPALKETLTEAAYKLLKKNILEGRIAEGVFLSEAAILKGLGIGRTPFREACNRLHHDELLEVVSRRGYMVRKMSFVQARDFFELRILTESIVAELAAIRGTAEQIDELGRLAEPELRSSLPAQFIAANQAFHVHLANMTGNQELVKVVTKILERSERISYLELRSARFQAEDLAKYHVPLAEAVRARDTVRARAAIIDDIAVAQMNAMGRDFWNSERESLLPSILTAEKAAR